jgi:hypothetical protein
MITTQSDFLLYELRDTQQECVLQRRWLRREEAAQRNRRLRQERQPSGWIVVPDDEAAWDAQLSALDAGHDGAEAACWPARHSPTPPGPSGLFTAWRQLQ